MPRDPGRHRTRQRARDARPRVPESSRLVAARILAEWRDQRRFPDRALERIHKDRPFITELVLGAVRRYGTLQWLLRQMVPRPPGGAMAAVIYTGFYQVLYMWKTDVFAAVHETVDAARAFGGEREAGLVNALLRRLDRERDAWLRAIERAPDAVRFSHPPELLHRWVAHYGQRGARLLCEWNNAPPDVTIRLRAGLDAETFSERLRAAGVETRPHPFASSRVLVLPRGARVEELPGFASGAFYVQDPSTLAAVDLLAPRPGERILDACAAPGGKTIQMAEHLGGRGLLIALDKYPERMQRLEANLSRMGHRETVHTRCADVTAFAEREGSDPGQTGTEFDAVLLDVPCSNTGVIRRRPDARWHLDQRRLNRLVQEQNALLDAAWTLLVPGGRLVYSTCSLEPEEDEELIQRWTRQRSGAQFVRAVKLLPHRSGTDGAYAALLARKE